MSSSGTSVVSWEMHVYYTAHMSVYDHNGSDWAMRPGDCPSYGYTHQYIEGLKMSGDGATIVAWKPIRASKPEPAVLRRPSTGGAWTAVTDGANKNPGLKHVAPNAEHLMVNDPLALAVSHDGSRIAASFKENHPAKTGGVYVVDAVSLVPSQVAKVAEWRLAGNVLYAAADVPGITGETVAPMSHDRFVAFGSSLSLSADGTRLAVGAPGEARHAHLATGFAPFARVYELVDANWTRVGQDVTPEEHDPGHSEPTGTYFGSVVRLSDDGSRLFVVAGAGDAFARVYELTDTDAAQTRRWRPLGQRLDFSSDERDWMDGAALSGDGSTVAFGTSLTDRNGLDDSGSVQVYRLEGHGTGSERWERVGLNFDGDHVGAKMGHGGESDAGGVALSFDGTRLAAGGGKKQQVPSGGRRRSVRVFDTTLVGPPPPPQHPIATGFQTGWAENNGRWELTTTPTSQSVSNGYFERGDVVQGIQFQSTWQNAMIGLHHEHSSPHNDYNQLDFMTYHNNQYKSSLEQNGFDGHPKQIPGLDTSMDSVYQFRVNAQEYVEFVRDGTVVWTFGVDDGSRKAYELYDRYHVATAWAYETTHWYNFQWVDSFGDPVGEQWSTPVDGSR